MRKLLSALALCAFAAAALAAIVELGPEPAYPLQAGGAVKAGEPVKLDANGRAVALGSSGRAVGIALGDATTNQTVTVKAGVFGFAAATNLTAATANGRTLGWASGRASSNTNAVLGACLWRDADAGTAYVRVGP